MQKLQDRDLRVTLFPPDLGAAVAACVKLEISKRAEPCIAAYVSGSRIDGLGNTGSDVDVYVVTDGDSPGDEIHRAVNGVAVEITFVARRKLEAALSALCCEELSAADAARTDLYSALLCHRFLSGASLSGENVIESLRAQASRSSLAANLRKYYQSQAAGVFKDAVGAYGSLDFATAALAVSRACSYAVDMYMAAAGDTNPLAKWRFKRLAASEDSTASEVGRWFRSVVLPLGLPELSTEQEYVFFGASLFQWLHDLVLQRIACVRPQRRVGEVAFKDPLCYLSAVDDKLFLISRDRGFLVTRDFVGSWLAVQHLPRSEISRFAASDGAAQPMGHASIIDEQLAPLQAAKVRILVGRGAQ